MENKSDEKFIFMQASVEYNKQYSDEKMTKLLEEFKTMFALLSNKIHTISSSPTKKDIPTTPDLNTVVPDSRRDTPL